MESFKNIYKFITGLGGSYGKEWNNADVNDLVQFNGIMVRNGVLDGSKGDLYKQWNTRSPMYIPEFSQPMTLTEF